jgi:hypothetical protein
MLHPILLSKNISNYYNKLQKYQSKIIQYGGLDSNCNSKKRLKESDCITIGKDDYITRLYQENILYQSGLSDLDRFIIWFYTWDSSFVNTFLIRKGRNINNEKNRIIYFSFYIDLFNLKTDLFD